MKALSALSVAGLAVLVAGCAQDGSLSTNTLNTSALPQQTQQTAKANPVCATLASQIAALNRDGTAEKVSKAALKKYKMKTADLAKADELNKANAEFQAKCSSYPLPTVAAATAPPAAPVATKAAPKKVAKAKPPVPSPKPVAAALTPQETGSLGTGSLGQAPPAQP